MLGRRFAMGADKDLQELEENLHGLEENLQRLEENLQRLEENLQGLEENLVTTWARKKICGVSCPSLITSMLHNLSQALDFSSLTYS